EDAIRNAIQSCQLVLLIASPNSRRSRFVRDEIAIAEMYKRPILPLWIDGESWLDSIPLGWGTIQHIDARQNLYDSAIEALVAEVKRRPPGGEAADKDAVVYRRPQVFLCYRYNSQPDNMLASETEAALVQAGYDVFVDDLVIPMGTRGA